MPAIRTDAQFLANHGTLDKQFEGDDTRQLEAITDELRKKLGYNPSPNDTYIPSLAQIYRRSPGLRTGG